MSKYSDFFLLGDAEYQNVTEKLRLRKYGSWLAQEAWTREEQSKKKAQLSLKSVYLARQIAADKQIPEEEAFAALQMQGGRGVEIFNEYKGQIEEIMELTPSGREQFEDLVTVFFRNRGQALIGKKWQETSDWEKEDTRKLPQDLLKKIQVFMAEEDAPEINEEDSEEGDDQDPKDHF